MLADAMLGLLRDAGRHVSAWIFNRSHPVVLYQYSTLIFRQ